jgi:hypothetical protein
LHRITKLSRFFILSTLYFCLLAGTILFLSNLSAYPSQALALAPSRPYTSYTPTYAPGTPTPTAVWQAFLNRTPFPYTTPLPLANPAIVDGSYAKFDPSEPQWWICRRCADYRPVGGPWKLFLDKGVFRMYYAITDWRSIASYTITEDRLDLFNDPYCPWETGSYHWQLENGQLIFREIQDTCAFGLRARNLTAQPWISCQPPSIQAAVSDHWSRPFACAP